MRVRRQVGSRPLVLFGALAVAFGIGLMTSAGYLIARAAERPAILSLTTVIVAVRFFGLARPVARYLERVVSHDLAFRVLARLACASTSASSRSRRQGSRRIGAAIS